MRTTWPGAVIAAAAVAAIACGSSTPPVAPTPVATAPAPVTPAPAPPPPLSVTGSWTGTAQDSQGATVIAWQLAQDGSKVSGTVKTSAVNPDDGSCSSCHRNKSGTFTGTLDGASLAITMFFAAGAGGDPTPACTATLTGTAADVTDSLMAVTYSGSDSCEGAFANGAVSMVRMATK